MGFRTVVVLNNDQSNGWTNDPDLGKKIFNAGSVSAWSDGYDARNILPYGDIVEQVHADTQTVVFLDGYSGKVMAHTHWYQKQTKEDKQLEMLKALADQLGYRVVKKSIKA